MLSHERYGDLDYATVPVERRMEAVASIKASLQDEERCCSACDYEAPEHRWGIKSYGTADPAMTALVLCCPACERRVDLPLDVE